MITVLLAARNGAAYISEQIDSILTQQEAELQLIVSDDCSQDETWSILETYEARFPGRVIAMKRSRASGSAAVHFLELLSLMGELSLLQHADPQKTQSFVPESVLPNWKLGTTELKALYQAAQADFFMLSDQDDVWFPEKAKKLLHCMQETLQKAEKKGALPAEVPVLVHSNLQVADSSLRVLSSDFFRYQKISPERTALSQLLVQNNITGAAVLLNRAFLPLLLRRPEVCLMHDAWLGLLASAFGTIAYVQEPLYLYRQHGMNDLGAEAGDSLSGIWARLKDGRKAKENYRRMFGQARCLLELFSDRLSGQQKEVLSVFSEFPEHGRIWRMRMILKYGFTKNTVFRTLGEMLMIG